MYQKKCIDCNKDFECKGKDAKLCFTCVCKRGASSAKKRNNNPTWPSYWVAKGYTEEEAKLEVRKRKKSCIEYWVAKGYTEEEGTLLKQQWNDERNQFRIAYWIAKGYTEENAKKEIKRLKKEAGDRNSKNFKRENNKLTKEYWLKHGLTNEKEIKNKIVEEQHNKLDYAASTKKSAKTRLKEWYSKTREERNKILQERRKNPDYYKKHKKKIHSPIFKEYWMNEGYTEEEAKKKTLELRMVNGDHHSSKIEEKFFKELKKEIPTIQLSRNGYRLFWNDGEIIYFCPDGISSKNNLIIEFQGTNIHLDERFFNEKDINPFGRTFKEIKEKDNLKKKLYLEKKNYLEIWEFDYKQDKEKLFLKIKEFLNETENCKSGKYWNSQSLQHKY